MVADIRKVALLMSCLPRPLAESLIERLPEEYSETLHHCLEELTDVDEIHRQRVIREFLNASQPTSRRRYRVDDAHPQPTTFHFLIPVPPEKIVKLLQDEMLQTQAVVLSQLPSAVTDKVLALMPEDRRTQVAQRLECLPAVPDAAMKDIAEVYAGLVSANS